MAYPVYLVSSLGSPRNHHAIFVETGPDLSGYTFQVTGNIQNGMSFEHKHSEKPEDSLEFLSKSHLGKVSEANYPRIKSILEAIPAPAKQFQGPKRIDPSAPLRRCQEWTAEAIEVLKTEGVLEA